MLSSTDRLTKEQLLKIPGVIGYLEKDRPPTIEHRVRFLKDDKERQLSQASYSDAKSRDEARADLARAITQELSDGAE